VLVSKYKLCWYQSTSCAGIKVPNSLPRRLNSLMTEMAQFKATSRR